MFKKISANTPDPQAVHTVEIVKNESEHMEFGLYLYNQAGERVTDVTTTEATGFNTTLPPATGKLETKEPSTVHKVIVKLTKPTRLGRVEVYPTLVIVGKDRIKSLTEHATLTFKNIYGNITDVKTLPDTNATKIKNGYDPNVILFA
jgi:hypothetical protein